MNYLKVTATLLFFLLAGCTSLPDVIVKDELADDRTRQFASKGVRIVKPEHAKQFDDPAWPTPLQIVVPRRESKSGKLSKIGGAHEVYLFQDAGQKQRIERLYVENAKLNQCRAALDGIGLAHRELKPAFIRVGQGGGNFIRCGSVVIESDTGGLEFRHPFISAYQVIDFADLNAADGEARPGYLPENFDSKESILRRYPIIIRYLDEY